MSKKMCEHSGGWRPEDGVPDLAMLNDITDEAINVNLYNRFKRNEIYTFSGSILIAINPYKPLDIYNAKWIAKYRDTGFNQSEPHVYALAEAMYTNLVMQDLDNKHSIIEKRKRRNQACVISGESGAGKTETTKFILSYLCSINSNRSSWIDQQILEANTILEAFGNAKTVRNDNSSRFGKFIQLSFDSHCQINGCIFQDYLLEQSRVTKQSDGERNYHVFYQLLAAGMKNIDLRQKFNLLNPQDYRYLNQTSCISINNVDDCSMFDSLTMALSVLHMDQEESDAIFSVLSAILLLGNIKFTLSESKNDTDLCEMTESDKTLLESISKLLGIASNDIEPIFLKRYINVRGTITEIPFKINEASDNRNGMAKALYSQLFTWIVNFINASTNPTNDSNCFLGVLDIFGFENFDTNSFEQLCINYANEKLHRFFNHHMFAMEQELYQLEGIEFCAINYTDNTLCLELLEKPPTCILRLLSEECRMPKGDDLTFIEKLHNEFSGHPFYVKGCDRRKWTTEFSVKHFAGLVTYKVDGILDKNRDAQQSQLFRILKTSSKNLVSELSDCINDTFSNQMNKPNITRRGSCIDSLITSSQSNTYDIASRRQSLKSKLSFNDSIGIQQDPKNTPKTRSTVADKFRQQLFSLVELLNSAEPWYVRCIKTNLEKSASSYDEAQVLTQLKYLGMSDLIKIRREGHPVHLTKHQFVCRYRCLLQRRLQLIPLEPPLNLDEKSVHLSCTRMMKHLNLDTRSWKIGKTMVFLKNDIYQPLETQRKDLFIRMAVLVQKTWRSYRIRKEYIQTKSAIFKIQASFRAHRQRLLFLRKKRAVLTIQAFTRGMFARETINALREIRRVEEREAMEINQQHEMLREKELTDLKLDIDSGTKLDNSSHQDNVQDDGVVSSESYQSDNFQTAIIEHSNNSNKRSLNPTKDHQDINELISVLKNHGISVEQFKSNDNNIFADLEKLYSALNLKRDDFSISRSPSCDRSSLATNATCDGDTISCSGQSQISSTLADENNNEVSSVNMNESEERKEDNLVENELDDDDGDDGDDDDDDDEEDEHEDDDVNSKEIVDSSSRNLLSSKGSIIPAVCEPSLARIDEEPRSTTSSPPKTPSKTVENQVSKLTVLYPPIEQHPIDEMNQARLNQCAEIQRRRLERRIIQVQQNISLETDNKVSIPSELEDKSVQIQKHECQPISIEASESNDKLKETNILDYAARNFNKHIRGIQASGVIKTLTRRHKNTDQSTSDYLSSIEMLTYNSSFTIPTSHIRMQSPLDVQLSCTIFKNLCKYMASDSMKFENQVRIIQSILRNGIERVEIRDEIYVQIIRQLSNNPHAEYCIRLWILLGLVSSAFCPSKNFSKFVFTYLKDKPRNDPFVACHLQFVLDNLEAPRIHSRKLPASLQEIKACKSLSNLNCKVHLPDGRIEMLSVHPCDTNHDALVKLAQKLNLQSAEGWAFYGKVPVTTPKGDKKKYLDKSLRPSAFVADFIASWHNTANDLHTANKTTSKKSNDENTPTLMLKKRLFKGPKIRNDPVEISLLYSQCLTEVVEKDSYLVDENLIIALAGIQAQILYGNFQDLLENESNTKIKNGQAFLTSKKVIQLYNPQKFINSRLIMNRTKKEWSNMLMQSHKRNHNINDILCKVRYLSLVIYHCPLYGTTTFEATYKGYQSLDQNIRLGVNVEGLVIIREKDKALINSFRYVDIDCRMNVYLDDMTIQMNVNDRTDNKTKCLTFETLCCEDIALLIASYSKAHTIDVRNSTDTILNNCLDLSSEQNFVQRRPKLKMTLEDRMRIHQDVQNARKAIVMSGKLRKHIPPVCNNSFMNTLKKLSSKTKHQKLIKDNESLKTNNIPQANSDYSIYSTSQNVGQNDNINDISRDNISKATASSENDEVSRLYSHSYWAYTKNCLQNSLLVIHDQDLEVAAMTNFKSILKYSGLMIATQASTSDYGTINGTLDSNSSDSGIASQQSIYQSRNAEEHSESMNEIYDVCPKKLDERDLLKLARECLDRCLKDGADILKNEFFLQLIKQTTDHPDPSSEINQRHWQLLALASSIIYPTDKKILAYLYAHLRRCSLDQTTCEGQYARFTLRSLQGTIDTRGRKFTPSESEILSTISCRRADVRVYFLDGHFEKVEFYPFTTIHELIEQIKHKIGLRQKCEGYYLLQSLDEECEQVLQPDEKVGDAISTWENWCKLRQAKLDQEIQLRQYVSSKTQQLSSNCTQKNTGNTPSAVTLNKTHRFIFKKYLFIDSQIDLDDTVERELFYYQTISSIKEGKFPIADHEAPILCALKAQIEIGDCSKLANLNRDQVKKFYKGLIMSLMPPHSFNSVPIIGVAQQHQALRGLDNLDAKKYFFNLIQSFGRTNSNNVPTNVLLHLSNVYKTTQTFASAWPSDIWLALDQIGMHMLLPKSKTLLLSCEYKNIIDYNANSSHLVIISNARTKYSFYTKQAQQIAQHMKDYIKAKSSEGKIKRKSVKFDVGSVDSQNNKDNSIVTRESIS